MTSTNLHRLPSPLGRIPRQGWNYPVDGYTIERKSLEALVEAVRGYYTSIQAAPPHNLRELIEHHICLQNPHFNETRKNPHQPLNPNERPA